MSVYFDKVNCFSHPQNYDLSKETNCNDSRIKHKKSTEIKGSDEDCNRIGHRADNKKVHH